MLTVLRIGLFKNMAPVVVTLLLYSARPHPHLNHVCSGHTSHLYKVATIRLRLVFISQATCHTAAYLHMSTRIVVHQQYPAASGLRKYSCLPQEGLPVNIAPVCKMDDSPIQPHWPATKSRTMSRSYAVANAVLRSTSAQVLPAIPRHMLPHLPRKLRESLDLKGYISPR